MADPKKPDANRDPITGAPGAHPVGVGAGATGGGATGAAIGGAVGGPVGAVVGAAVGAVAGGLAGKGAAEAVNPTVEDAYWRDNYKTRPYASGGTYDQYRPAYQHGWESVQPLSRPQVRRRGAGPASRAGRRARPTPASAGTRPSGAARDAWDRVERAMPGDFDKDGK